MIKFGFNLSIGILLFLLTGCHSAHHGDPHAATFKVSGPLIVDTTINREYVSQIHAYQHIELRALEKGYLQEILVDEGQRVLEGQLLFKIQPTIYLAEAQKARSELEFARVEYANIVALAEKDIVSQSEVALAKAQYEKAQAELDLAEAHVRFTEIRAPFPGIVGKFEEVRLGSLLDEGELLTTLSDNRKMWVYFNVPESEYLDYAMMAHSDSDHVHLRLANGRIFSEEGIIETIESDFNNTTGNIAFRATFPNPNGLLRHGQTGDILWPKILPQCIIIPQKATFEILDKKFVFVVDEQGLVASREVDIADELPHIYLLHGGVNPGDRFLLEGLRKVRDGERIHTEWFEPEQVLRDLQLHAE